MDLYENLVQIYLTVFEHLFVIPQFNVVFDDAGKPRFVEEDTKRSFERCLDFLAVDIKKQEAQLVEVSKERRKSKVIRLVSTPNKISDREKIENYVKWFAHENLKIRWRFFVRSEHVNAFRVSLQDDQRKDAIITPLEDVFEKLKTVMP